MSVILLPLHLPATHWVPQRLTYAPIPKQLTPSAGAVPRPELDYWEFANNANQALRAQFRMPAGYDNTVQPLFSFDWFTTDTNEHVPLCKLGQAYRAHGSPLASMGVGALTTIIGMVSTDTSTEIISNAMPIVGTNWSAGRFCTIVFYRNGSGADAMEAVLNFLGGDLLIAVTKEMG